MEKAMTRKKRWLTFILGALMLSTAAHAVNAGWIMQNANQFAIYVKSDKQSYLPGEMVSLHFEIANRSDAPVLVNALPTVWDGYLKVFIAFEDGNFKEYIGPAWGTRDRLAKEPRALRPGESFETDATLLWNQKPETSHLSEMYAKSISKARLGTDYALADVGRYYIKAVLLSPETGTSVESSPLSVVVERPDHSNLEVWKTLKRDPDYALFIQTGGLFEDPNSPKTIKVAGQLEKLLLLHPESRYVNHIRLSLSKRNETIQQIKQPNE